MGLTDWDWRLPVELQTLPWDCAAASLTWCLNTVGIFVTEAQIVAGLGPSRINSTYGLLDASGAGLVSYLDELGVRAENDANATWDEVMAAAGYQPMLIGGREWCHWTGVRMGSDAFGRPDLEVLALANPAPGWYGVDQLMEPRQFRTLGPFSAVWFTAW